MARRHHRLGLVGLVVSLATLPALAAFSGPPSVTFPNPPTVADLADTGASQPRDLSLPQSRGVLNPLDVLDPASPAQQNNGPDLPLSAGYYAADEAAALTDLLTVNAPFAGFGNGTNDVRHPITGYTIYGLLEHGAAIRAQTVANATIRDTVLADMISERYQWEATTPPHGEGQRPSLFGALAFIDAVWMNNGCRMDDGVPSFVDLPGGQDGLSGLHLRGYSLDLAVDATARRVAISGSIVTPGCGTQSVPVGSTVALSAACSEAY